jgi:site-specific recombinase XerC
VSLGQIPHNLRHRLASYLVRTGTDPKTVQNLLRHSNVKTTLQLTLTAFPTIDWRRKGRRWQRFYDRR